MNRVKAHLVILLSLSIVAAGQKTQPKFNDAIKRSEAAAETIERVAGLSEKGIPKPLIEKAAAIGVFPCKKTDLLIEHAVLCPGVISARIENGWSLPSFFRFGGGGLGRPDSELGESSIIILIFMGKESVDSLTDGRAIKFNKVSVSGPVGSITTAQITESANAQILVYDYRKDKLRGISLKGNFFKGVGLVEDNHINTPLYGMKGREVLGVKNAPNSSLLPSGILLFQDSLKKNLVRSIVSRPKWALPNSPSGC